jgi:hypothetical protein
MPGPLYVPFVFGVSALGGFLAESQFFMVWEVLVFGVIGFALRRLGYPLGSFLTAVVLGQVFETNLYLTQTIYSGFGFIGKRPLADVLLVLALVVVLVKALEIRRTGREQKRAFASDVALADTDEARAKVARAYERKRRPYPLLDLVTTASMLGVAVFAVFYAIRNYDAQDSILPVVAGLFVAIPAALSLPRSIFHYVRQRRMVVREPEVPRGHLGEGLLDSAATYRAASDAPARSAANPVMAMSSRIVASASSLRQVLGGTARHLAVEERAWGQDGQYRRELVAFVLLFLLMAVCWAVGFQWGVPAFVLVYGVTAGRYFFRTRFRALVFAVVGGAAMWGMIYTIFTVANFFPYSAVFSLG